MCAWMCKALFQQNCICKKMQRAGFGPWTIVTDTWNNLTFTVWVAMFKCFKSINRKTLTQPHEVDISIISLLWIGKLREIQ